MATIIRKGNSHEQPSGRAVRPVAFSFADMRGQADDYLEVVRQEAAKIIQQAHRDGETIRRQAETAGRKAAEAAIEKVLEEKVARRMDTLLPALEQLVSQLNDAKGELLTRWERSATRVITAISERVIRREMAHEPSISLELISEAIRLASGAAELTLHINPTDHEHLGPQVERVAASLGKLAPNQIVPDATVSPGGCRVVTKFGVIDQQIESQLRRIEEDLA